MPKFANFLLNCQTSFITYKLQKKEEPDDIKEDKKRVEKVMKNLTIISSNPERDFFDS